MREIVLNVVKVHLVVKIAVLLLGEPLLPVEFLLYVDKVRLEESLRNVKEKDLQFVKVENHAEVLRLHQAEETILHQDVVNGSFHVINATFRGLSHLSEFKVPCYFNR